MTKRLLESALEGEMSDRLSFDRRDLAEKNRQNSRNDNRSKTAVTDVGPVTSRFLEAGTVPSSRRSLANASVGGSVKRAV
ncbi:transposase [Streptomyces chryseus]